MTRSVVLLSGGLDSSTLLYQQKEVGRDPIALTIEYGQRHSRELLAAKEVAAHAGVAHYFFKLPSEIFGMAKSSQVGGMVDVPQGHYAHESMKLTVVPNRNILLIATAVAFAISRGIPFVAYAAHAGDHAIYPDCRPEFSRALADAIARCDWNPPVLDTPFINITKTEIVQRGQDFRVPFELTYSCYEGHHAHCGKCGTCVERKEAFVDAGVIDPTIYVG